MNQKLMIYRGKNNIEENIEENIEDIINNYADMVYKLAYSKTGTKHDADDIFQEVFIRYVKKQPIFKDENHRKAWLIRVTINCSNNFFNTAFRKKTVELKDYKDDKSLIYKDKDVDQVELKELQADIQKIPKKYREVIHLFYYEELSIEEISFILKRRSSTIRTQLTRARRLLKDVINEEDYYA